MGDFRRIAESVAAVEERQREHEAQQAHAGQVSDWRRIAQSRSAIEERQRDLEAQQAAAAAAVASGTNKGSSARTGSGTRFSGAPLWRFTLRKEQKGDQRLPLEGESQEVVVPEGFVQQGDGIDGVYFNSKYGIFWKSDTQQFFRFQELTKTYHEIAYEPSLENELRLLPDASCIHRHHRLKENKHVIVKDLARAALNMRMPVEHLAKPLALFAIYDGHRPTSSDPKAAGAGTEGVEEPPPACAEFCARNFHLKLLPRLADFRGPWDDIQIMTALRESCDELDTDFLTRNPGATDGCSAVVALLTGRRLFMAGVGDAVGYLGAAAAQGGLQLVRHTVLHAPSLPQEIGRIAAAGGAIVHADGDRRLVQASRNDKESDTLHLARAFGDRSLKQGVGASGASGTTEKASIGPSAVIATPDVVVTHLEERHQVFILASGELSALPESKIAEVMVKRKGRPRVACGTLLREMQTSGGAASGSLTALCVFLDWKAETPVAGPAPPPQKKPRVAASAVAPKGEQVRVRQILVKHRDCKDPRDSVRGQNKPVTRSLVEAERILLEALEAIEGSPSRSIFTQRCKAVSECSTCLKGGEMSGDLGWVSRGQLHPAVDAIAFSLPVGHISDIVESDEGVHVLWRIA